MIASADPAGSVSFGEGISQKPCVAIERIGLWGVFRALERFQAHSLRTWHMGLETTKANHRTGRAPMERRTPAASMATEKALTSGAIFSSCSIQYYVCQNFRIHYNYWHCLTSGLRKISSTNPSDNLRDTLAER
jgi:hypothetical protein